MVRLGREEKMLIVHPLELSIFHILIGILLTAAESILDAQ